MSIATCNSIQAFKRVEQDHYKSFAQYSHIKSVRSLRERRAIKAKQAALLEMSPTYAIYEPIAGVDALFAGQKAFLKDIYC